MSNDPFGGYADGVQPRRKLPSEGLLQRLKPETSWEAKPRKYKIKGQEELKELFTVGDLAKALDRTPATIRRWETLGIIPRSRIRSPKPRGEQVPGKEIRGHRLYSRGQIQLILQVAHEEGIFVRPANPNTPVNYTEFTRLVRENWLEAWLA